MYLVFRCIGVRMEDFEPECEPPISLTLICEHKTLLAAAPPAAPVAIAIDLLEIIWIKP